MAKIDQGILGGYRGKVGPVVGYYRLGQWCVRAYQPHINDARSAAQLRQRSLFKAMIQAAAQCVSAIRLGMRQMAQAERLTEGNLFLRRNSRCFAMDEGGVTVDYAGLQLSLGTLPNVEFGTLRIDGGVRVEVDYEKNMRLARAKGDDRVYLFAYAPALGRGYLSAPSERRRKRTAFVLPDEWAQQQVEFYGFTIASDGTASPTAYLGSSVERPSAAPQAPLTADNSQDMMQTTDNEQYETRQTDTLPRADRSGGAGGLAAPDES